MAEEGEKKACKHPERSRARSGVSGEPERRSLRTHKVSPCSSHRRLGVLVPPRSGGVWYPAAKWRCPSSRRGAAVSLPLEPRATRRRMRSALRSWGPGGGAERGEGGRPRKRGILLPPPSRSPPYRASIAAGAVEAGAGGEGGTSNPPQQPGCRCRVPLETSHHRYDWGWSRSRNRCVYFGAGTSSACLKHRRLTFSSSAMSGTAGKYCSTSSQTSTA